MRILQAAQITFLRLLDVPLQPFLLCGLYLLISCRTVGSDITTTVLLETLFILLILSGSVFSFLMMSGRIKTKAAIVAVLLMTPALFFLEIQSFISSFAPVLARYRYLVPIILAVETLSLVYVIRTQRTLYRIHRWLNLWLIMSLLLVALEPQTQAQQMEVNRLSADSLFSGTNFLPIQPKESKRDIYYIILDGHAAFRSIRSYWKSDYREFGDALRKRGFRIADSSLSFAKWTVPSMASTLNLSNSYEIIGQTEDDLLQLIKNCLVARFLDSNGYRICNLSLFEMQKSVPYYSTPFWDERGVNDVAKLLGFTLPAMILAETRFLSLGKVHDSMITALENPMQPKPRKPTFFYAHFMAPHYPYIYDRSGNQVPLLRRKWRGNAEAYLDNLVGIDKLVLDLLDHILALPGPKPIIVIQSDHGSRLFMGSDRGLEAFSILNALYLPDKESVKITRNISPYNTFRLVFNLYFDQKLLLLEDGIHY